MTPFSFTTRLISQYPELYELNIIRLDEPMSAHTSFRIGGPADAFCLPESRQQLYILLEFARRESIPCLVIGNGTNLLVSDTGIRGLVISTKAFTNVNIDRDRITSDCGVLLSELCDHALAAGLGGLEFACGIPGTVGGAVFMNAGAYGGEIADVLESSLCFDPALLSTDQFSDYDHCLITLDQPAHQFAYRKSSLQERDLIHIASTFRLKPAPHDEIKARMDDYSCQRSSKQPLDLPSAGSVFKRPVGHFTGKLIDDCELRGYRIGGAMISSKHCGFIVNTGDATAADVLALIEYAQKTVWERFGVQLETEIRLIGE